jgi:drug/metabolite transporter (DMT)-like permease
MMTASAFYLSMSKQIASPAHLPMSFYLQILICAILWGSAFPVIKNSYSALHITTYSEQLIFAGTRFLLAGLMIVPFCRGKLISKLKKAPRGALVAIILGQTYFQYIFFYYGLSISTGTLGALLVGTGSFWWMLLAPVILKTAPPRRIHWVLLAVCSVGIACAVYEPGDGIKNAGLGTAVFLAASFCGAVGATFMKKVAPYSGSRTTTSFALSVGGLMLLLTAIPSWSSYIGHFNLTTLLVTLYLAFLSATAFTLWNRLIERYSINVLSTFRFLIPLMGVLESTLFIPGETLRVGLIIGAIIVFASLIIISRVKEAPAVALQSQ